MTSQTEQILEDKLVAQLVGLGYKKVLLKDEADLLANLKKQLELHNNVVLSSGDFKQILNYINTGGIFRRAKILRDRVPYTNEQGEVKTIELINQVHWCKNEFQVCQQITIEGTYKNRYDVTILINGLPLVQIELKRRGLELKEAFNQINRYQRHSYGASHALFQFIQLFVISNGVNTKYFANTELRGRSFKQTFYWADKENTIISNLPDFCQHFLEPCHLSKMITKYTVLNEANGILMVLRPYQFYAVEAIVERVQSTPKYGFIWHTTGSGKTLTSFKAAQILTNLPKVYKVVFVVDRKDLDYQTAREFNAFSKGSIDGTDSTKTLVEQLTDDTKLIVTTIQKLNSAISKKKYLQQMQALADKRIVFIFDECHRSQFGKTHKEIKSFFSDCQMFGFTGTPIFSENANSNQFGKRTTEMLFGDCLHKYVITDAIRDENVLKFSVEYIQTFTKKEHIQDDEVEAIDEAEVWNEPERLDMITNHIIDIHAKKTHNQSFTGLLCVSSVPMLIEYMNLFLKKEQEGKHQLKVATIFSYGANEEDQDAVGYMDDEDILLAAEGKTNYKSEHSRDALEGFIKDYNRRFGTNYTTKDTQSYYNYYNDIAKRVRSRNIDLLIVVNMFLTGFDSKHLNTLYVDKNLQYHGLIQAFSRTNRILDEKKSQGNIVCFRPSLKEKTDEAITLFSNKEAIGEIIIKSYEEYIEIFNEAFERLKGITPTIDSVNELVSEDDEFEFIQAFRELMRLKNRMSAFTDFRFSDLAMTEQEFEDYKSKYLDLYDKVKPGQAKEKVSILNDIDFELELIHRDEINVSYILRLMENLLNEAESDKGDKKKKILDIVQSDPQLRSKSELIEQFIERHLPDIEDSKDIGAAFETFVKAERSKQLALLAKEEQLIKDKLEDEIEKYLFKGEEPLRDDVIGMMRVSPRLLERAKVANRVTDKIKRFVETYVVGVG